MVVVVQWVVVNVVAVVGVVVAVVVVRLELLRLEGHLRRGRQVVVVLRRRRQVAPNAVVALGLVGAGTNNARLAGMLRNLSSYYYKEPTMLYLVRGAQPDQLIAGRGAD